MMTLTERPASQPDPLSARLYPSNLGEDFVYPEARARELAKADNMAALATSAELPVVARLGREHRQPFLRGIWPTASPSFP